MSFVLYNVLKPIYDASLILREAGMKVREEGRDRRRSLDPELRRSPNKTQQTVPESNLLTRYLLSFSYSSASDRRDITCLTSEKESSIFDLSLSLAFLTCSSSSTNTLLYHCLHQLEGHLVDLAISKLRRTHKPASCTLRPVRHIQPQVASRMCNCAPNIWPQRGLACFPLIRCVTTLPELSQAVLFCTRSRRIVLTRSPIGSINGKLCSSTLSWCICTILHI